MNFTDAKNEFEHYLDGYNRNNDKVRLKIIHTYGVVHDMEEICHRMALSPEDTELAKIIALHSNFKLENISNPRTLLHARLIRDADKLDNCRVKLEDDLPVFMGMSGEDIGAQTITPKVYDTVLSNQCIYSPDRVTKMDYWVSYVAHFCDIYFRASFDIIKEHDYLNKIIDRIPYSNPDTKNKMETIRSHLAEFIHHAHGCEEPYKKSLPL